MTRQVLTLAIVVVLGGIGVAQRATPDFNVNSTSFGPRESIPIKFTCKGEDASPGIQWSGAPPKTVSFVIIMDDPDAPAGTWVHWVMWNIPATVRSLPEGVAKTGQLPDGARQGRNSFGKIGYNGPCPPPGQTHRYYFRIYALDGTANLTAGSPREQVDAAMQGHILAQGEYMGTFHK